MKAIWNETVIAESQDTVVVEGNHYFPAESVDANSLESSGTTSVCPWKGTANYKSIIVNGESNPDAAWFYADPKPEAAEIRNRFAFWNGVEIVP